MIVEFNTSDAGSVLVNSDKVVFVSEETRERYAVLVLEGGARINVRENFTEIKKRLGMAITPRAETLAVR